MDLRRVEVLDVSDNPQKEFQFAGQDHRSDHSNAMARQECPQHLESSQPVRDIDGAWMSGRSRLGPILIT
jgi:hypothetical protein